MQFMAEDPTQDDKRGLELQPYMLLKHWWTKVITSINEFVLFMEQMKKFYGVELLNIIKGSTNW